MVSRLTWLHLHELKDFSQKHTSESVLLMKIIDVTKVKENLSLKITKMKNKHHHSGVMKQSYC